MLPLQFLKKNIIYVSRWCLCLHAHVCAAAHRGQQRALHLLQLELKVVESCIMWRARIEFQSSSRAARAFDDSSSSLAPS